MKNNVDRNQWLVGKSANHLVKLKNEITTRIYLFIYFQYLRRKCLRYYTYLLFEDPG